MANKRGRRRRFGAVRQYRSGSWTASYLGPDGERIRADETFETKKDAEIWLSQVEADLSRGDWRAPSDSEATVWLNELRAHVPDEGEKSGSSS